MDPNFHMDLLRKLFLEPKKIKSQTDTLGINTSFWQSRVVRSQLWEHPLLPAVWSREAMGVFQCTLATACMTTACHAQPESCSPSHILTTYSRKHQNNRKWQLCILSWSALRHYVLTKAPLKQWYLGCESVQIHSNLAHYSPSWKTGEEMCSSQLLPLLGTSLCASPALLMLSGQRPPHAAGPPALPHSKVILKPDKFSSVDVFLIPLPVISSCRSYLMYLRQPDVGDESTEIASTSARMTSAVTGCPELSCPGLVPTKEEVLKELWRDFWSAWPALSIFAGKKKQIQAGKGTAKAYFV